MVRQFLMWLAVAAISVSAGAATYRPLPYAPAVSYRIGGPAISLISPYDRLELFDIQLGGHYKFGDFCHEFDPSLSLKNLMGLASRGADRMQQLVVSSLTGAVTSLPLYYLKQKNPSLYEIMMSAYAFAAADVEVGLKSCQQYQREVSAGGHPLSKMFTLAIGDRLRYEAGLDEIDLLAALETAPETAKVEGTSWIGGQKGGETTPPIEVNADTVKAGYQALQGRDPQGSEDADPETTVGRLFGTQQAAVYFVQDVLGDMKLTLGQTPEGVAGMGVRGQVEKVRQDMLIDIVNLLADPDITVEKLDALSANGLALARPDLDRILNAPPAERDFLLETLAGRAARGHVLDRMLLIKDMLLAGRRVPEIAEVQVVQEELGRTLAQLDDQVEQLFLLERAAKSFGELPLVLQSRPKGGEIKR